MRVRIKIRVDGLGPEKLPEVRRRSWLVQSQLVTMNEQESDAQVAFRRNDVVKLASCSRFYQEDRERARQARLVSP